MRLLQIAVEKRRWDLAAHTIVLATARVLKNGVKPLSSQRASEPSLGISDSSAVDKVIKTEGREFERAKRRPKGQSER